jgi:hypothetical protein
LYGCLLPQSLGTGLELICRSYGRAAARAYVAYKNPIFLEYAIQSWWFGRSYTLSQDDVASGKIATKSFTVQPTCQNSACAVPCLDYIDCNCRDHRRRYIFGVYFHSRKVYLHHVIGTATRCSELADKCFGYGVCPKREPNAEADIYSSYFFV